MPVAIRIRPSPCAAWTLATTSEVRSVWVIVCRADQAILDEDAVVSHHASQICDMRRGKTEATGTIEYCRTRGITTHTYNERRPWKFPPICLMRSSRGNTNPGSLTRALAPHLYTLDREPSLVSFSPSRQPVGHAIEKFLGRRRTLVSPRLVSDALGEESIGAADGDVQNQVERLVERRVVLARLRPWVVQCRVVQELLTETAAIPHGLVESEEEDLLRDD